jgi:hypothetical protein
MTLRELSMIAGTMFSIAGCVLEDDAAEDLEEGEVEANVIEGCPPKELCFYQGYNSATQYGFGLYKAKYVVRNLCYTFDGRIHGPAHVQPAWMNDTTSYVINNTPYRVRIWAAGECRGATRWFIPGGRQVLRDFNDITSSFRLEPYP